MFFSSITFHWYGLLIALGVFAVYWYSLKILEKEIGQDSGGKNILVQKLENWFPIFVIFGIVGARIWHVFTDFYLYQNNLWSVFAIWNGGLSIFGAIAGVIFSICLFTKCSLFVHKKKVSKNINFGIILDALAIAAPFGQAIGRVGNIINQELYGMPTNLPWKWYIAPEFRSRGFESFEYYHPLPLYEIIFLIFLGFFMRQLYFRKFWKLGSLQYFLVYLSSYGVIRILLDMLRIQKEGMALGGIFLGYNQLILIFILFLIILYQVIKFFINKKSKVSLKD